MNLLRKYWLGLVMAALAAIAGWMIYVKLHPKTLPPNLIEGVGHIDGDLVRLNAKYPGRLLEVTVDDGVPVKKDQVIARLKSREYEAQKEAIEKEIAAKRKELAARKTELQIAKTTTPQMLNKAQDAVRVKVAQIAELQKNIDAQADVVAQDRRDLGRMENLYRKRLIQKEALEKSRLKYRVDRHRLEALRKKMAQAKEALAIARSDLADARAAQRRIEALREGIDALIEGIGAIEAKKAEIEAVLDEMTLRSPLNGFTVEKIANAGEVIGAGMPVATLIDPRSLYLKIFVDTLENGKIKLHDKAVIFLDAYPDRPIAAEVVRIAQKAEFTPKEVNVRSDRIQRVYAVHLKPLKVDPLLKLGLPAIGVISIDGKGLPHSLNALPEI